MAYRGGVTPSTVQSATPNVLTSLDAWVPEIPQPRRLPSLTVLRNKEHIDEALKVSAIPITVVALLALVYFISLAIVWTQCRTRSLAVLSGNEIKRMEESKLRRIWYDLKLSHPFLGIFYAERPLDQITIFYVEVFTALIATMLWFGVGGTPGTYIAISLLNTLIITPINILLKLLYTRDPNRQHLRMGGRKTVIAYVTNWFVFFWCFVLAVLWCLTYQEDSSSFIVTWVLSVLWRSCVFQPLKSVVKAVACGTARANKDIAKGSLELQSVGEIDFSGGCGGGDVPTIEAINAEMPYFSTANPSQVPVPEEALR